MDWPRIRPRDGTDLWSDASNLSGDKVGKDYEQLVRGKLLGESGQQDDRDIEVSAYLQEQECRLLMNLWREAFRASQESWETNHEPQYRFNRPITTKTDVRLTRRINIPERLGIGAEVLCGNPRLPARTIVEISVNGVLSAGEVFDACHSGGGASCSPSHQQEADRLLWNVVTGHPKVPTPARAASTGPVLRGVLAALPFHSASSGISGASCHARKRPSRRSS
eukprot:s7045_g1.t1